MPLLNQSSSNSSSMPGSSPSGKGMDSVNEEGTHRPHSNSNSNSISSHYLILRSNSQESQPLPIPRKAPSIITNVISKLPSPASNESLISSFLRKTGIKSSIHHTSAFGPTTKSLDYDDVEKDDILLESLNIPEILLTGLPLLRITSKKRTLRSFKIDLDKAILSWSNKSTSRLSIDKIQQIRVTNDAKNYREEYGVSNEYNDRWITIVYNDLISNKIKTLHIVATTSQDFELFTKTLIQLVKRRKELMKILSVSNDYDEVVPWTNFISKESEKDSLTFKELRVLLRKLHIYCDENYLLSLFDEFQDHSVLYFSDFEKFVKLLKKRPEIESIFKASTKGSDAMNLEQFTSFIQRTQKELTMSFDQIEETFKKISNKEDLVTLDHFTNYLKNCPIYQESTHDMTRPLNEYYISSSHNTYLIGKQYGGSASIEGYIKALQRGCRCIEIDIWDGDEGPVVSHGKLTSSIPVKDVFEVVKKFAFVITPFPLFLSFEIHCKVEFQCIVHDLLYETLGDLLIVKNINDEDKTLPSPEDLKGKILVKFKKVGMLDDPESDPVETTDASMSSTTCDERASGATAASTTPTTTTSDELSGMRLRFSRAKKLAVKIIPELYNLSVYSQGLKFRNFSLPESKTMYHIFSFSENSFNSTIKDHEKEYLLLKHNRRFLMRLYPSGFRYTSKNFIPIKFWNYGVQMAATNWQTYDLGQQVNEALFNAVDKKGYYLKHKNLRDTDSTIKFKFFNSESNFIKFRITILSAQYLPKPSELKQLNPNVMFSLVGTRLLTDLVVTDLATKETTNVFASSSTYTTPTINNNGFNPTWNYQFEGLLRNDNDLNFIKLMVKSDDTPIATNCFNITDLRRGYRHCPLFDMNGEEYIFSSLFLKIEYEYVK
ncbi:hypothetical protein WICPIJ_005598 [Wickerhamomyces pijperi]|uniref:Phosphoinositide phospholipase C n=1 Tax=Wickerhamomyces pijperi TaxID=599730 RepID=A0A9P8Q3K7_WICPI|nr:hypothetical protein WICPIJ_005598 [Wickerhamomyces pijperi]